MFRSTSTFEGEASPLAKVADEKEPSRPPAGILLDHIVLSEYIRRQMQLPQDELMDFGLDLSSLTNCQLETHIFDAFRENRDLGFTLNLSTFEIGAQATSLLASCLKSNTVMKRAVTSLAMAQCALNDSDVAVIAHALPSTSVVKKWNLQSNVFGWRASQAISSCLLLNRTLEYLDLSNNSIGDKGIAFMAKALHTNSHLRELILYRNQLSRSGAELLLDSLHNNVHLEHLTLGLVPLGDEGSRSAARMLNTNSTLRTLSLWNCSIADRGGIALATSLHSNRSLSRLILRDNCLTDVAAVSLAESLSVNPGVHHLNLSGNRISAEGALALNHVLTSDSALCELDLSLNNIPQKHSVETLPHDDAEKN